MPKTNFNNKEKLDLKVVNESLWKKEILPLLNKIENYLNNQEGVAHLMDKLKTEYGLIYDIGQRKIINKIFS